MELLAMELKDIMAILIASMLVFVPFVILFNPKVVALWKHKKEDNKQENKQVNPLEIQNNAQNTDSRKVINEHEATLQQPIEHVEEQRPNSNATYTVTSFKDEESNNN